MALKKNITVDRLKGAAQQLGKKGLSNVKGLSKLKRADLENVVMTTVEGRRTLYNVVSSDETVKEEANRIVDTIVRRGFYFIKKPKKIFIRDEDVILKNGDVKSGMDFYDLAEVIRLRKDEMIQDAKRQNHENTAGYLPLYYAIKDVLKERRLKIDIDIDIEENDDQIKFGLIRRLTA